MARAAQKPGYGERRVNALDVGRGLAIVSVIYGHALAPWFMGAGDNFSEGAFLQWKFGASFMMVFFFFLSGVGWREDKSLAATFRQSIALVLMALLASAAFDVFRLGATLAGFAQVLGLAPLDLVHFIRGIARMGVLGDQYSLTALWFLVALGVVRVVAALASRLGNGVLIAVGAVLLTTTLISTELGLRNFWQINLIGVAFVSFLGGHFARDLVRALEKNVTAACALLLVAGALTAATFHLNDGCRWDVAAQCGQDWLGGRFGVSMVIGQFGNLPMFALTAFFGAWFAMALCIVLARIGGIVGRKLDSWGRNSLNLLIVNSLFLHMLNPAVERWVMPRIEGEGVIFFVGLLVLIMAANLWVAHAMTRPLRRLTSLANALAAEAVDQARRLSRFAIVALRGHRVSQGHE